MTKIGRDFETSRTGTDNIWEAIYTQRAIRYWEEKPVPRDLLERVVEAGSKGPSGNNLQPWVFVVIDDRSKLDKISRALREWSTQAEELQQYQERSTKSEDKSERLMRTGAMEFFFVTGTSARNYHSLSLQARNTHAGSEHTARRQFHLRNDTEHHAVSPCPWPRYPHDHSPGDG